MTKLVCLSVCLCLSDTTGRKLYTRIQDTVRLQISNLPVPGTVRNKWWISVIFKHHPQHLKLCSFVIYSSLNSLRQLFYTYSPKKENLHSLVLVFMPITNDRAEIISNQHHLGTSRIVFGIQTHYLRKQLLQGWHCKFIYLVFKQQLTCD